jgi:hypothetical protein
MKNYIGIVVLVLLISNLPNTYSQDIWTQSDWSNNQYTGFENLDPDASPGELILLNDPSNMVYAFSPTGLEGVWDLEVYDEKLFIAACTKPVAINGGEIIAYDYGSNSYEWEYDVWEQGVIQLRTFNGKLFVPGIDSQGGWDWGNCYIFDGNSWTMKSTIPHGIHVFDLIFYRGAMYVTTGTDLNNNSGKVYKSTDEGETWMEVYSVAPVGSGHRRFYMMGIYQDTLYIQSDLKEPEGKVLFRFDGNNWTTVPFDSLVSSVGKLEQYNDKFYFLNGPFFHIYNGLEWNSVNLPFSGWINDPLTGRRIQKGMGFYKKFIYGGGEKGLLYRSADGLTWKLISELGSIHEEIEAIEVYHGRLYVGVNDTTGTGKVYVSASVPSGILISEKHNFINPISGGTVSWEAFIHKDLSSVRFQIRSADSENGLELAQFIGPDGTQQSFYELSGQSLHASHFGNNWIQYKVFMSSIDSAYTPVLQEVSIAVSSISGIGSKVNNHSHLQCNPIPFTSTFRIAYSLSGSSAVKLEIINNNCQLISTLVNEVQLAGKYKIVYDGTDLPKGIYFCVLKTNEGIQTKKMIKF